MVILFFSTEGVDHLSRHVGGLSIPFSELGLDAISEADSPDARHFHRSHVGIGTIGYADSDFHGRQGGSRIILTHTVHIVNGSCTRIGSNCTIAHGVNIGHGDVGYSLVLKKPRIGDRVYIGPRAIPIGDIDIGCDALIGPGAVVIRSVPERAVVVGNPERIISQDGSVQTDRFPRHGRESRSIGITLSPE